MLLFPHLHFLMSHVEGLQNSMTLFKACNCWLLVHDFRSRFKVRRTSVSWDSLHEHLLSMTVTLFMCHPIFISCNLCFLRKDNDVSHTHEASLSFSVFLSWRFLHQHRQYNNETSFLHLNLSCGFLLFLAIVVAVIDFSQIRIAILTTATGVLDLRVYK